MPHVRLWARVAAAIAIAASPFLSGCAELMLVNSVTAMAKALPSNEPRWVETHRLEFAYPVEDVYALLLQSLERSGRKIIEQDAALRSVLVSYPFSLLQNNWGGSLKITCAASEFGTTVTIQGDGRDVVPHVRSIGDEVLDDVANALRRQARTL